MYVSIYLSISIYTNREVETSAGHPSRQVVLGAARAGGFGRQGMGPIHIYIYIYMYTHIDIHMYVCIYIYIYTHTCLRVLFLERSALPTRPGSPNFWTSEGPSSASSELRIWISEGLYRSLGPLATLRWWPMSPATASSGGKAPNLWSNRACGQETSKQWKPRTSMFISRLSQTSLLKGECPLITCAHLLILPSKHLYWSSARRVSLSEKNICSFQRSTLNETL